jgi:hypothetical protein
VHYDGDKVSISYDEDQLYPSLPPSDPAKVTKLQGQLQRNDLFPFSIEENSDDEAFLAAFNDGGDEGAHLRHVDKEGFNEIIFCPSLAQRNPRLTGETFEQRAKRRGRDSGALQLALRLFCGNYEQHYGSLADQRLIYFPPTLTSRVREPKAFLRRDAFHCTKINALFRDEQFEYEKDLATTKPAILEKQHKEGKQQYSIISPTAWSGVRNANKEIEGILLQRLLWKVLVIAARRIHQGGGPQSLEEHFFQNQWDTIVTLQADELRYRADIQNLVFEYITCLLGEEYQLCPDFSGRVYDYSICPNAIRKLDSLAHADQPSSITSKLREKTLCPVAMRVLCLFSELPGNRVNDRHGETAKDNETVSPPSERVEYFRKQRRLLRKTTPRWKSNCQYLSLKDVVKPIRARLSVSEAAPNVNIMSAMLAAENTRDPKHYDLDYDQIWAFSRKLPTYSKDRNFFSLKFYDGVLRKDVIDPWDDECWYAGEGRYFKMPVWNPDPDSRIRNLPAGTQPHSQVWFDEPAPNELVPEVGGGQIMPLPLIDFDPEKLGAEQAEKEKKWKIPKYLPGYSRKFIPPETELTEADTVSQIQKDLDGKLHM